MSRGAAGARTAERSTGERAGAAERAAWRRWAAPVSTLPAWTLTAALALLYLLATPASSDLAAAGYRSDLFSRVGFTLWDNGWYWRPSPPGVLAAGAAARRAARAALLGALAMTIATGCSRC